MRRAVAVLAACAGAALPLGCGGGSGGDERTAANQYVTQVNAAQTAFARRFGALSRRIGATLTPAEGRRTLTAFEDAVDGTVARLRRVEPPARVGQLHGRLIGQIAHYGDEIAVARRAFSSRDPKRVLAAQGRLVSGVERTSGQIDQTIDAINRRLRT